MGCGASTHEKTNDNNNKAAKGKILNLETIEKNILVLENKGSLVKYYKILDKIGNGFFGKVYKVFHNETGQLRALKVVKKEIINLQDDSKKFLKDIEVLSQIDHPNIIKIFEYFIAEDSYFVIVELAKGCELMEIIEQLSRYSENQAAIIMEQLFSCVAYMHSKGIVHRDLKPENIMMESSNIGDLSIKLIDFGSAYSISNSAIGKNLHKEKKIRLRIGTPYYMAPEVIAGYYDKKCDLWSLGIIMYILLGAEPPFIGEDDFETFELVKIGKYTYSGSQWSNVSKSAKALIDKLLTLDPKKRLSAEEALKDPWILSNASAKNKKSENVDLKIQNKFTKFKQSEKLEQAIMTYLVHNYSSNEYCKELKTIFKKLDTSGDGRLSYEELRDGLKKHFVGFDLNDKEFSELVKSMDKDGSEFIEYEEFLSAFLNKEFLLTEKNLNNAFSHFDEDRSGKLGMHEIKILLGFVKNDIETTKLLKKLIKEYDLNGDGEISLDEFKILMRKLINP
jgi:calcium-dependent protein kinase